MYHGHAGWLASLEVKNPSLQYLRVQVSIMSVFEYYRMAIPMFVPSPSLLTKWQIKYR